MMSAVRIAVSAVGLALAMTRHPLVRAGIAAAASNPKARATAEKVVLGTAYNAGVVTRHLVGKRQR